MDDRDYRALNNLSSDKKVNNLRGFGKFSFSIDFYIDVRFIAILPAVNINFHSRELEFEWIIFGIYLGIH